MRSLRFVHIDKKIRTVTRNTSASASGVAPAGPASHDTRAFVVGGSEALGRLFKPARSWHRGLDITLFSEGVCWEGPARL